MTATYRKRTPAWGAASTLALAIALAGGTALAQGEGPGGATTVKIGAQPLDQALTELGAQAGVQIVVVSEDAAGLRARPIEGRFTGEEAVDLLLKDSGLIQRRINDRTIVIGSPERLAADAQASWLRFAQVDTSARSVAEPATVGDDVADDDETAYETIETIVVTGTNIRGVTDSASPLLQFDRDTINRSGAATAADFIQRAVPQNFAAGAAEDNFGNFRGGADSNFTDGAGVNLRGLGTDSTLVLINGRRVAASGNATFVDVTQIPLSAIERVDILTDGASAIYGSDAVGGVVNFVLRDDFDGAETQFRYATVTDGDLNEFRASQAFGKDWGTGNALISYEYYHRDNLDSAERAVTDAAVDPFDVLPETTRHSVFLNVSQDLSESIELFATALYTNRDSERRFFSPGNASSFATTAEVEQIAISFGSRFQFANNWNAELAGTFSQDDAETPRNLLPANTFFDTGTLTTDGWVADAKIDGPLFALPGGDVQVALGGQFRSQNLESTTDGILLRDLGRDVYAVFGEVLIPIFGENNARAGIQHLELTGALRFEGYDDAGSSTDPKIGLLWSPVDGLNLRGTWSTSFRAPLLVELDTSNPQVAFADAPDPMAADGITTSAILIGNDPNTSPETSTNWTVGFDFSPQQLSGLDLSVTYFDIDFEDRIATPDVFDLLFNGFSDPVLAPFVSRTFEANELGRKLIKGLPNSIDL